MNIVLINAASHTDKGTGWCSCGETVRDCYYIGLLLPAHRAWVQMQYEDLFAGCE